MERRSPWHLPDPDCGVLEAGNEEVDVEVHGGHQVAVGLQEEEDAQDCALVQLTIGIKGKLGLVKFCHLKQ